MEWVEESYGLKKVTHQSQTSVWWPQQPSENCFWEVFHSSLCWTWVNSPSLVPNAAGTRVLEGGSLPWICVLSCSSTWRFEKCLWEKCFLQFSWRARLLLPSCHVITCCVGPLTQEVGGLNAAHCTAPNLHLPRKGALVTNQHSNLGFLEETEWFWMCFLDGNVLGYSSQARCWPSLVCAVRKA